MNYLSILNDAELLSISKYCGNDNNKSILINFMNTITVKKIVFMYTTFRNNTFSSIDRYYMALNNYCVSQTGNVSKVYGTSMVIIISNHSNGFCTISGIGVSNNIRMIVHFNISECVFRICVDCIAAGKTSYQFINHY